MRNRTNKRTKIKIDFLISNIKSQSTIQLNPIRERQIMEFKQGILESKWGKHFICGIDSFMDKPVKCNPIIKFKLEEKFIKLLSSKEFNFSSEHREYKIKIVTDDYFCRFVFIDSKTYVMSIPSIGVFTLDDLAFHNETIEINKFYESLIAFFDKTYIE